MQVFYPDPLYKTLQDAHLHPMEKANYFTKSGGRLFIATSTEDEWQPTLKSSKCNQMITPFLGIHPWFAHLEWESAISNLEKLLQKERCGVGEIGLDKYRGAKKRQEELFYQQLLLAKKYHRPITLHSVGYWPIIIEMLEEIPKSIPLLFHGYAGSLETAKRIMARHQALFSFGMRQLMRPKIVEMVRKLPLSAILLETDYSATTKEGISREQQLCITYQTMAKLHGISLEKVSQEVWKNGTVFTT